MPGFVKTTVVAGVVFGIALGALLGFISEDYRLGAVGGLAAGIGFGLLLAAFAQHQTTKFTAHDPTAPDERLLKQGPANHFLRGEGVGGFLFLSDSRLLFRPHRYNIQKNERSIPLTTIEDVQPCMRGLVIPNGLRVVTTEGDERFVVQDRRSWVKAILAAARPQVTES